MTEQAMEGVHVPYCNAKCVGEDHYLLPEHAHTTEQSYWCDACRPGPAVSVLIQDVVAAVLEAYEPAGVVLWLTQWLNYPDSRERMEAGVLAEWSGPEDT